MIPYGRQNINQEDIDSVLEVLNSDFLTQGPKVPLFEQAITDYTGAKYALAVNSATSALHIACLALGVGKEDIVWTTPVTFVASSNCALYCGAKVDFVDIDPKTYNISIEKLNLKLQKAKKVGKLPKVIIPVHLCGQSCDMEAIKKLSLEYDFKIIEDASHAIGAKYKDKAVGCCEYSDIAVFSFHPVKIITTAEGGVAVTNNSQLARKMDLLRSHGVTRDQDLMTHASDGPWYYQQIELGFNYRMTEMQAALGVSQMKRLDEFISKRQKLAKRYDELLESFDLVLPYQLPETYSSYHLYIIRLDLEKINRSHSEVFCFLREAGIGVNLHYIPVHTQPYYKKLGFLDSDFPESLNYYATAISIPLYSDLSLEDQDFVVKKIEEALK